MSKSATIDLFVKSLIGNSLDSIKIIVFATPDQIYAEEPTLCLSQ